MKLTDQVTGYVNAAFTGLWIQTQEPDEAEREIVEHAKEKKWRVAVWDVATGIRIPGKPTPSTDNGSGDPVACLRALPALADQNGSSLLLLHNYHRQINNAVVIQTMIDCLVAGKQQRTFIVILAPVVQIPVELEKLFVVIEHALPDREQLESIGRQLMSDRIDDFPQGDALQSVLDAAAGLTRYEAEGAFSLSLTRHRALRPESVWELKAQTLRKNNLLSLHRGEEKFDALGGLQALKDFCKRALRVGGTVKPRGILLLSPPGCGKSAFAKALGNEIGRPTLLLDLGALMGSLVGQSEANVRQALRIADAMSPCVLFVDELEKALSGVGGSGDSGVSTRMFGTLLTWLSDHSSDVFFIGTCNDISRLPPEFSRAERFDAIYFIDLPTIQEKESIWQLYRQQYGIRDTDVRPKDSDWTGAEIKSCCRLTALLDQTLTQAAHHVVPVAVTAAEQVDRLRTWASGRCLSASDTGVYSRDGNQALRPSRRLVSNPSDN
jgi:hypothetical protein